MEKKKYIKPNLSVIPFSREIALQTSLLPGGDYSTDPQPNWPEAIRRGDN